MRVGDKIRVIRMDDSNGKDPEVHRMNGVVGTIDHIDDMGYIHLKRILLICTTRCRRVCTGRRLVHR